MRSSSLAAPDAVTGLQSGARQDKFNKARFGGLFYARSRPMFFLLKAAALFWAFWIVAHFVLLTAHAVLAKPDHPCFNGFKIILPAWMADRFTEAEYAAIVCHEEGHRHLMHVWENLARACCFFTVTPARRHNQELEADDYAIERGHGIALAAALMKMDRHPSTHERIMRIMRQHL